MPRKKLSPEEKRSHSVDVRYNSYEHEVLGYRAMEAGRNIARFVREISLSDDVIQTVSLDLQLSAKKVRKISEQINLLYSLRIQTLKKLEHLNTQDELEKNSNSQPYMSDIEAHLWREVSLELNELNAELLGYA